MIVGLEALVPASSIEINMLELRNWLITMAKRTDQSSWFLPYFILEMSKSILVSDEQARQLV